MEASTRWPLVTNPAALIGVLYVLTEPLAILCTTAFLVDWRRRDERVATWTAILLALALLARETTLFVHASSRAVLALRRAVAGRRAHPGLDASLRGLERLPGLSFSPRFHSRAALAW